MKAVYTQHFVDGMYVIRQSLGGAGYSAWSAIPQIIEDTSPTVTYEGDNTVMAQQSFNFIIKQGKKAMQGKERKKQEFDGLFNYLNEMNELGSIRCKASAPEHFLTLDQINEALRISLTFKVKKILEKMKKLTVSKKDFVNSKAALDIVRASCEHIRYITFLIFMRKIQEIKNQKTKENMTNMCMLYGLVNLNNDSRTCYESGYFIPGIEYSELIIEAIKLVNLRIRH